MRYPKPGEAFVPAAAPEPADAPEEELTPEELAALAPLADIAAAVGGKVVRRGNTVCVVAPEGRVRRCEYAQVVRPPP